MSQKKVWCLFTIYKLLKYVLCVQENLQVVENDNLKDHTREKIRHETQRQKGKWALLVKAVSLLFNKQARLNTGAGIREMRAFLEQRNRIFSFKIIEEELEPLCSFSLKRLLLPQNIKNYNRLCFRNIERGLREVMWCSWSHRRQTRARNQDHSLLIWNALDREYYTQ